MEPWQEEDLRQLRLAARLQKRPRCACCDERIPTERCLNLAPFGLNAVACENCVETYWGFTEDLV